ncbi:MAG: alpha/beta hydrolase [Betaproteobacteria bacterium]
MLVHGLWMRGWVLAYPRIQLAQRGYRPIAFSYPSVTLSLDSIARRLADLVRSAEAPVHLVGHSLGGLVVLQMLASHPELAVKRVVLLGSPCMGSSAAKHLARCHFGRAIIGKAIVQWRQEDGAVAARQFQIGVIAGTQPFGLGRLVMKLPRPNDGVVLVDETRLPGATDHITMRVSHTGLIFSSKVNLQVSNFLKHGHFSVA